MCLTIGMLRIYQQEYILELFIPYDDQETTITTKVCIKTG